MPPPTAITSRRLTRTGEYRVTSTFPAIITAHVAAGLPIPSPAIILARLEAVAYYTDDLLDARDTEACLEDSLYHNPFQLIHARDLRGQLRDGPTVAQRLIFRQLLQGQG